MPDNTVQYRKIRNREFFRIEGNEVVAILLMESRAMVDWYDGKMRAEYALDNAIATEEEFKTAYNQVMEIIKKYV